MSNSIYEIDYLRSLPDVLKKDKSMLALAKAIAEELNKLSGDTNEAIIYARIDHLSEGVLDILAYDFKVDWWDYNFNLEEKRRILKTSWNVHRRLGTKAAVEKAISAIYPDTKVEEWFEYGGAPYKFKLLIDATYEGTDPVKYQRVLEKVNFYKNIRSHLDGVEYIAIPAGYCTGFGAIKMAGAAMDLTVEVAVYGLG